MKKLAKKENKNTEKKKEKKYSGSEFDRYLGALNEVHQENLKAMKEGFVIVNRKLDEHTEILDHHTRILDEHSRILDEHTRILDEHTRILGSHSEMIGTLMEDMTVVKDDISIIKGDLKKKVDYDEFFSLVKRVQKLEARS